MDITFKNIADANKTIQTTDIKGKQYAEVNERIKAFRMCFPGGAIITELVSDDGERCVFRASIHDSDGKALGTGTAYEVKSASFINKTSYIENCETSAVGRALAMCGFGIDTSIVSAEEVENAINNQEQMKAPKQADTVAEAKSKMEKLMDKKSQALEIINSQNDAYKQGILAHFHIESLDQLTEKMAQEFLAARDKKGVK